MLKLENLSHEQLIACTKTLVERERRTTLEIIHHICEIDRRKLYLERAYSSLFEFVVKELGYDHGGAARRIESMRLIRDIPEVEHKIQNGNLSLTTVSQVAYFFKAEEKSSGSKLPLKSKLEVIERVNGLSKRECEKVLMTLSSEKPSFRAETLRAVSATKTRVSLVIEDALLEKLKKVQELASHRLKDQSLNGVLEFLADEILKRIDPTIRTTLEKRSSKTRGFPENLESRLSPVVRQRQIPGSLKRQVWIRDQGSCTFQDPGNGRICGSRKFLQYDHVRPWSLGGKHEVENLRLLCSKHNQLRATQTFRRSATSS